MFATLPLWGNLGLFAASAAVVWLAGTRLAGYADAIAERTGIGRAFIGILLLGGVTSLPEMASSATAALAGAPALAVNGVLGSAAINVVILATADAAFGRDALTTQPRSPQVMLQAVLGMLLMAIVMGAVMVGDRLVLGMGAWSWVMLLAYLASLGVLSKAQDLRSWIPAPRQRPPERAAADTQAEPPTHLYARTVAVGVVILLAGFVLAQSADATAEQTGLGESFFGAVFLGLSTSLPEWSTVLAAVRIRRYEMAMADVLGTNLFNVTIVVLVDALHEGGPVLSEVSVSAGFGAMLGLLLTGMMLAGMIERRDRTVLRMGYDSLAVMVTYAIGVVVLYRLG